MKRAFSLFMVLVVLFLTSCGQEMSDISFEKNMNSYIGCYKTSDKEISLTIFDISDAGQLIYEIGLKDNLAMAGTAFSKDEDTDLDNSETYNYYGNIGKMEFEISLKDNEIILDIINTYAGNEENIGSYKLYYVEKIETDHTSCDTDMGTENHYIFNYCLKNYFENCEYDYKYLGSTSGEFCNTFYTDDDSRRKFDLYKIDINGGVRYYFVCPTYPLDYIGIEYKTYEFIGMASTTSLGTYSVNNFIDNTQSYSDSSGPSNNQLTTPAAVIENICSNCHNVSEVGHNFCSDCECDYQQCYDLRLDDSAYCYTHICNSGGCKNGEVKNSSYCVVHKCCINGCNHEKAYNSEYCNTHKQGQ